jgi:predicted Zn-dependent peptidase
MMLAWPGVGARHEDYYATRLLAEALGGGMSSRLFQTVREERGLAYSVYAFSECYDETGFLAAYAGTEARAAVEAAALIRGELESAAEGLSQAELDRARALLRSSLLMALESPMGRVEMAAGQFFAFGRALSAAEIRARLDAVGVDDLRRCARRAASGRRSVSIVGPCDKDAVVAAAGASG